MSGVIHEIRNHLTVAVANVEALRDGVLAPTPERLAAIVQALREADALLDELRAADEPAPEPPMETIDVCRVLGNEVLALEHGRSIDLVESDGSGARFLITLPGTPHAGA